MTLGLEVKTSKASLPMSVCTSVFNNKDLKKLKLIREMQV